MYILSLLLIITVAGAADVQISLIGTEKIGDIQYCYIKLQNESSKTIYTEKDFRLRRERTNGNTSNQIAGTLSAFRIADMSKESVIEIPKLEYYIRRIPVSKHEDGKTLSVSISYTEDIGEMGILPSPKLQTEYIAIYQTP